MLFEHQNELQILIRAISAIDHAVSICEDDNPHKAGYAVNSGAASLRMYEVTGRLADLNRAIASGQFALKNATSDDKHMADYYAFMAHSLSLLHASDYKINSLQHAAEHWRRAVSSTSPDHPDIRYRLRNCGDTHRILFEKTREIGPLKISIKYYKTLVSTSFNEDLGSDKAAPHCELANVLFTLFQNEGKFSTLIDAIRHYRLAIETIELDGTAPTSWRGNLGAALIREFERTGKVSTLEESVKILREAAAAGAHIRSQRPIYLSNLSAALQYMFQETGDIAVLNQAVDTSRSAVASTPLSDADLPKRQNNLCIALLRLYGRNGDPETVIEAVKVGKTAVSGSRQPHYYLTTTLGIALLNQYFHTKDVADAQASVDAIRMSVSSCLSHGADRAWCLYSLAKSLMVLFTATNTEESIRQAIAAARDAVDQTEIGNFSLGLYQSELGSCLRELYDLTKDTSLLSDARTALQCAANSLEALSIVKVRANRNLAYIEMQEGRPAAALDALGAAVNLLPKVSLRTLSRADREYSLGDFSGLATMIAEASAIAGLPARGVELVEQARGFFLNQTIEDRRDIRDLHKFAPKLYKSFVELRRKAIRLEEDIPISNGGEAPGSAQITDASSTTHQRLAVSRDLTRTLEEIRAIPELKSFMLPPNIRWLQRQASEGPVIVVYAGMFATGALILTEDSEEPVRNLLLPSNLTTDIHKQIATFQAALANAHSRSLKERSSAENEICEFLEFLWQHITGPIVDKLTSDNLLKPSRRVWWCPIGKLSYLPFHAAGMRNIVSPDSALLKVVSSYTITVRALEYARSHTENTRSKETSSALLVAMPETPGDYSALPASESEIVAVGKILQSATTLVGENATSDAVLGLLGNYRIVHFSCHGSVDFDSPTQSMLVLHDHATSPLTVDKLSKLTVRAELAFLSACSTSQTSSRLIDEGIHLASALQTAGFRSVIGTLSQVSDDASSNFAIQYYSLLTNSGKDRVKTELAAEILAQSIIRVRNSYRDTPSRWIAYIHYGA